ncbi:MAG: undecaprenyl-phosphate alpha-N-acetylglucosaminyl 1-phosphate transferase, partial [Candidatus Puniceispirillaceae bacterium]
MYLSLFISVVMSLGFISILRKSAPIFYLIDMPGGRKKHQLPVPLIGGLAIYFTIIASVALHGD